MKILAIGDIHGKTIWREAVKNISADKIVFVGDYVIKSKWIRTSQFESNLIDIIELKLTDPDRVCLLLGNHDTPFVYANSIFTKLISPKLCKIYRENSNCFDVAYQYKSFLFTHAGVSNGWYHKHASLIENCDGDTLADKLNSLHRSPKYRVLHERGRARNGLHRYGGITYADKTETEKSALQDYTQVVGHTKVAYPVMSKSDNATVIYIDCLNSTNTFLIINDDAPHCISIDGKKSEVVREN
jgi:hypothetical protein